MRLKKLRQSYFPPFFCYCTLVYLLLCAVYDGKNSEMQKLVIGNVMKELEW